MSQRILNGSPDQGVIIGVGENWKVTRCVEVDMEDLCGVSAGRGLPHTLHPF